MSRPRSRKVSELKAKLLTRIEEGFYRAGDRFLSNRALAARFGVSYQTAHRLIAELCKEGWIERQPASGTYIAGKKSSLCGVHLLFHARARREGSFGARLIGKLRARLEREKIKCEVSFVQKRVTMRRELFPVIWECKADVLPHLDTGCYALLLHDFGPAGVAGTFIDTVSTDDYSGGVCAAEVFRNRGHARAAVLAGPRSDHRSVRRVEGFCSLMPDAKVIWADGWFLEDGLKALPQLMNEKANALFCCNDRLAESVLRYCNAKCQAVPYVIGFDDAPIAEVLNITTIALPWDEMVDSVIAIIRKRLRGDASTAARQILTPRPIVRR